MQPLVWCWLRERSPWGAPALRCTGRGPLVPASDQGGTYLRLRCSAEKNLWHFHTETAVPKLIYNLSQAVFSPGVRPRPCRLGQPGGLSGPSSPHSHHLGAPRSCPALSHQQAPVPQALGTTQHWYDHPSTPTPASLHFEKPHAPAATVGSAWGFVRCFFTPYLKEVPPACLWGTAHPVPMAAGCGRPGCCQASSCGPPSLPKAREEGEHEATTQRDISIKQG